MDSFFNLFDPSCDSCQNGNSMEDLQQHNYCLPPEPQAGNIEYKLKIVNPSKQRFEHLVTQVILFI